jgi:hypothetical protein
MTTGMELTDVIGTPGTELGAAEARFGLPEGITEAGWLTLGNEIVSIATGIAEFA